MPTLQELAFLVDGRIVGDPALLILGFAGIEAAGEGDITFVADEKWHLKASASKASAIVSSVPLSGYLGAHLLVSDPNLAFALIVDVMVRRKAREAAGIHPRAVVHASAIVDPTATLHACVVVESEARIGAGTVLHAGCFVGHGASIGSECILHPNVSVMHGVRIANRVIIHSGTVIGSDGFGYATSKDGIHVKIPQAGTVIVEDDVEIGANVCIDRARLDATRIGHGTKIDNLVQIAHNVVIGPHSLLIAQVGIAGSTELGHHVVLAGHVGITGHIKIGDGAQVSAFSGVGNDLEGGKAYMGVPARPISEGKKIRLLTLKLPEIYQRLKEAERTIARLVQENGTAVVPSPETTSEGETT